MISASSLLRCSATTGKNATISNVRPPRRPISTPAHANILWYHHHLKIYTKISHPILARRDCPVSFPPINMTIPSPARATASYCIERAAGTFICRYESIFPHKCPRMWARVKNVHFDGFLDISFSRCRICCLVPFATNAD